ncbi:MAG: M48 family metallopeptidase [Armatimonadetes bacterium]|nr:M48 family metallopeptidase [Armatimonadota bacterium]
MPKYRLGQDTIEYEIIRNARRRRFEVAVHLDGRVVVRAPSVASDADCEKFLAQVADWLRAQLSGARTCEAPRRRVQDPLGTIEFIVRRNPRRRRMALHVNSRSEVEVRAPNGVPLADIDRFVLQHADWVRARVSHVQNTSPAAGPLETGQELRILGEPVRLVICRTPQRRGTVRVAEGEMTIAVPETVGEDRVGQTARGLLRQWLGDEALKVVRQRLPEFARRLGVSPAKVTVKDMKTRWGSCGRNGNISISYRLVMAPPEVMDYLIVHELCHLLQPNHSREYWALVAGIMPEYRRHRTWLKEHSLTLAL